MRHKQIVVDSFVCKTCDQGEGEEVSCREIVNIPCLHCYQCFKCWEKEKDKRKCKKCSAKVDQVMRIYFARQDIEDQ